MRIVEGLFPTVIGAAALAQAVASAPVGAQIREADRRPEDRPVFSVGPKVRVVNSASATSVAMFGNVLGVRELSDGRVLVNDGGKRQLVVLDSSLRLVSVALDSLTGVSNTYGTLPGGMVAYTGDSTLFFDRSSYAILTLGPAGEIASVRAIWRTEDVYSFTQPFTYGWPGVDRRGRVVFRLEATPERPTVPPPPGVPWIPTPPDTAYVVAVDLATRDTDTLGTVKILSPRVKAHRSPTGAVQTTLIHNPLPLVDGWAVMPDGRIALLRGRDYRIDYLGDGPPASSPKIPFPWVRLEDEDKKRIVDSVRTAVSRTIYGSFVTSMVRWANTYNKGRYPSGFTIAPSFVPPPGWSRDWKLPAGVVLPPRYVFACGIGEEPRLIPGGGGGASLPSCIPAPTTVSEGPPPPAPTFREPAVVAPAELPDYKPPFGVGAVRSDLDGRLWVRINPPFPVAGGPIYDVINSEGELVDRIQIPTGYGIVGFGRGRVLYLLVRDSDGQRLARVRLR